ncbi:MAG: LLM class flavin-dependent oxidoreductase [Sphingobium sp.]
MTNGFRLGFLTHLEGQADLPTLYRNFIQLFKIAEELGFDAGWVAQHHFEDGRNGPGAGASPFTFLAAVAENTRTIRLGTAVITLPLESPIRLAEDASTVDVISGGRVELGISSGGDPLSFKAFGASVEHKRELTTKGLELLRKAFAGEPIVDGHTARVQPHAPGLGQRIWQGVFGHEGAAYAGRGGSHLLLNRATYGYEERTDLVQRPWAETFLEAWHTNPENAGRKPRIGLSRLVFPARDRAAAKAALAEGVLHASKKMVANGRFPAGLDLDGYLERFHAFYGHPDEVIEQLQGEQVLPLATDILCQVNPGVVSFDETVRVLELIATKIAPALGWKHPATLPSPAEPAAATAQP